MKSHVFGLALLSVIAVVASAPAQAQNGTLTRSFVSSSGVDSNPCTITQPCASFAVAYTKVDANGIVAALDPGKYGPITITSGVTINGNGWAAITAAVQSDGITINAGSGHVTLIGLEIDGAGNGYNGIDLNSAGSLTVTNCTLQNFIQDSSFHVNTGNGILLQPTSGTFDFAITNTIASNNGYTGVGYLPPSGSPSANGVIDHVIATANFFGIEVDTDGTSGGATVVTVSNSTTSDDSQGGIAIDNTNSASTIKASIDNVSASGNNFGIEATHTTNVLLSRSVITGNSVGINNLTSSNTFYSFGNNQIGLNATDGSNTLNKATYTLQ